MTIAKLEKKLTNKVPNKKLKAKVTLFFQTSYFIPTPSRLQRVFTTIKKSNVLEYLSFFIIIFDSLILSIDHSSISLQGFKILTMIDFICLIYFFFEVLIRISMKFLSFYKKILNILDLILFALNLFTLIYLKSQSYDIFEEKNLKFYNLIRCFQIIRIYRLLVSKKISKGIATLVLEITKMIKEVSNFLIIVMIFLLMASLIGKDIFLYQEMKLDVNPLIIEEIHRMNFLTFSRSLMSNFMIFFDEDWHLIMLNHMKAFGNENIFFFFINTMISTMFLNKLFLALLINKLIESSEMRNLINTSNPFIRFLFKIRRLLKKFCDKIYKQAKGLFSFQINKKENQGDIEEKTTNSQTTVKKSQFLEKLNKFCAKLVFNNKWFDKFMVLVCCLSLVLVALHDPFQSIDSFYNKTIKYLDIPIFIIFVFEIIIFIFANDKGNFSDKIVLQIAICVVYLIYFVSDLKYLKLFVIFRFFMIINYYKELKYDCEALLYSLWDIFHLFIFYFLFILLFAAVGVKLYKGALWRCQNVEEEMLDFIESKVDCFDFGGDWVNSDFNFDNILNAIDFLFILASSSGWLPLM